jgi:hypothetical protein
MANFTWTTSSQANNRAKLTFTPPVGQLAVYDFSDIRVGDHLVVLGPEFAIGNRGDFVVESVDIANRSVTYVNPGVAEETVNLSTTSTSLDKVSFWHSATKSVYDSPNPAYVTTERFYSQNGLQNQKSKASLPVNTDIIVRDSSNGSYFPETNELEIATIVRLPSGKTTFNAKNSQVAASGHILVSGVKPKLLETSDLVITPGVHASPTVATGRTDSSQFSHAFTDTYYTGCFPAVVTDLKNRVVVIGGRNIETSTDLHSISVFTPGSVVSHTQEDVSQTYTWSTKALANISGVGTSAVVLNYPRFWNKILIVGGYPLGPGSGFGTGYTQQKSFLYSVDTETLTEITGSYPASYPADCALVWTGSLALFIGGVSFSGTIVTNVSVWDPSYSTNGALGKWYTPTSLRLKRARANAQAIVLDNGKVLVAGGRNSINLNPALLDICTPLFSCEIITPRATAPFVETVRTGSMTYARFGFGIIKLPDGRVLVVGGCGYKACESVSTTAPQYNYELTSCELYDPELGIWSPIPDTLAPHSYCTCSYDPVNNRVYVVGGSKSTKIEYLDLETMTWHFSIGQLSAPSYRTSGSVCNLNTSCPTIVRPGGSYLTNAYEEKNTAQTFSTQIYNEQTSGRLNGLHKLTGENAFTSSPGWCKSTTGTVTKMAAQASTVKGPYAYDRTQRFGISGTVFTSDTTIPKGRGCPPLTVTEDITSLEQTGFLAVNFGRKTQVGPVKYTKVGTNKIQPDPHFNFPFEILNQEMKLYIVSNGAYAPKITNQRGAFYLTASNAGLAAAKQYLTDISASGIDLDIVVRYPGDRGLGNEGSPVEGASKLSDIIEVFGPDDLDTALEVARDAQ